MCKKKLRSKTINELEYYSTLNITNSFSNSPTKFNHQGLDKEQSIAEIFKEINNRLNTKYNNGFFFKGNPQAQIMVLSDYPDDEDYNSQKILSGNKGRLLSKMLSSISLDEEKYYLSNIFFEKMNKTLIEYNFYENILFKHIKIIKPKYILLLGESVLNFINNLNQKILDLHGKWGYKTIEKNKFLIFFTFSPEELIKDEGNKKLAWEDLKIFRNEIHKIK